MTVWKAHLIREKLIDKSKEMGLRLPQMQMLLAQERFLARLFSLDEGRFFIWKGGSLFIREYSMLSTPRYTVDVDLLLKGTDFNHTRSILEKACKQSFSDGFEFSGISVMPMERDTPYGGDRFEVGWTMFGKSQSESLKLDICSGDVVVPILKNFSELSVLSDDGFSVAVNIYPAEFIFAEKLETLFRFGTGNTRCKDLIDLWMLTQVKMAHEGLKLSIEACFKNRNQNFSSKRLKEIFEDVFYVQNMSRMIKAHFENLKLPSVSVITTAVLEFCFEVMETS